MPIRAAIDIGTNSTRLLVARVDDEQAKDLHREARVTRLGQDVHKNRVLADEAIKRTIHVLCDYKKIAQRFGAESVIIGATSAARDAQNIQQFIDEVKEQTGLEVRVLSAQQEAQLSFRGASDCIRAGFKPAPTRYPIPNTLVLDIGGGSTELISPPLSFSKDIGSVRLTELFIKNDPPLAAELDEAAKYVEEVYKQPVEQIKKQSTGFQMIGVAGTITTLAALNLKLAVYEPEKIHCSMLGIESVEQIFERLKKLTTAERQAIKVIQPGRADVIVAGALILLALMKMLEVRELLVSETDILDGLLRTN